MATAELADTNRMPAPGRPKQNFDRRRVELVAEADWIARVNAQAERLGLTLSAYVRQAVTLKMEKDEAEAPPQGRRKPGGR